MAEGWVGSFMGFLVKGGQSVHTANGPVEAPAAWPKGFGRLWDAVPLTTLPQLVGPALEAGGSNPAVIFDDGVELPCDVLLGHTERFAAYLGTRLRPGDRVALAAGNRAEFLVAYLAVIANRAVVVTLGPDTRRHDAAHMIGDAGCVLAIAEPAPARVFEDVRDDCPALQDVLVIEEGCEPGGLARFESPEARTRLGDVEADVSEMIDIGYTSGTTGLPKALAEDHRRVLAYVDFHRRWCPYAADERILCPTQFHYGDALWLLWTSLVAGTPLIMMRRFSVSRFWKVAREYGATGIMTIGAIPNLLLAAPPSPDDRNHRVRYAISVGLPKGQHQELVDRFGFPWLEAYGLSESGSAIVMPHHLADRDVGTGALGIPTPDTTARLVDEDGATVIGAGCGELELQPETPFLGYLNNPEATAEATHDGWLRTGDLMRRDEQGIYYFLGRRKELIRRGGENVAPAEVEAVLRLHPSVVDAAVVPVADSLRGEEIKAYVEVRPGNLVQPYELADFCADRLAAFKVPRFIELRYQPFPRTPTARIPKSQLKVGGAHQTETAWDREARGAPNPPQADRRV